MNQPAGDNGADSSWDSLASELGLEAAPTSAERPMPPKAPTPPPRAPIAKKAEPLPEPEPDSFGDSIEAGVPEIYEAEATSISVSEATEDDESSAAEDENLTEESASDAPGGGKRRRRRRRRKKGGGEPSSVQGTNEAVKLTAASELETAENADAGDDEEPAVIVGEAADLLEDDGAEEEGPAPPALADESIEDDSTEPLPEWKVVAWTDLIATLYRPQDR